LPLRICLDGLWESTSLGIQYLTHFINRVFGYGNVSNGLNPDMCPVPTNGPNYLHASPSFPLKILKQICAPLFLLCITEPLDAHHLLPFTINLSDKPIFVISYCGRFGDILHEPYLINHEHNRSNQGCPPYNHDATNGP
jgi:hypothetical protein